MLTSDKKRIIRNWAFDIGYEKATETLKKEHDNLFANMGDSKTQEYNKKKIDRLEEVTQAIHYVYVLKEMGAHQLGIFK